MKIIKASGAVSNTWLAEINGFLVKNGKKGNSVNFDVLFTSDERGETLSISYGNRQFVIPFEPAEELIKHTRKQKDGEKK